MPWHRLRNLSGRQRKIWFSLAATALGTAMLTQVALWVQAARNTDFNDRMAGITAADLEVRIVKSPVRLRDVAAEAGVVMRHGPGARHRVLPEDTGSGLAWGDYDADGDFDLFVVNFAAGGEVDAREAGRSCLFRNDGGRFTDVAAQVGVDDAAGFGMGACWADYDDDSHLDLFVTNYGTPNRLYRNHGDGTFEEVADKAGVAASIWSTGAAWGDFDRDGHLDLYVCNYVEYDERLARMVVPASRGGGDYSVPFALNPNSFDPAPNRLYRNRGDGTFEDVTARHGVEDAEGRSLAATFVDLDGDGWLDLYVANDVSPNKLFRNVLGATAADVSPTDLHATADGGDRATAFADFSAMTGTADVRGSMGLAVAETGSLNGNVDGLPDLFITHWVAQENVLYQSLRLTDEYWEYRDKTREFRLGEISLNVVGWGCGFCDLDLDGCQDLVVANGSTLEYKQDPARLIVEPTFVFWNDGHEFHEIASQTGQTLRERRSARGLAIADFNGDGLPDVAISLNRGEPLLLLNETRTENCVLKVRLRGPSARCFGAKVEVRTGSHHQVQWYGADASFLSQHAPELIFGLGPHAKADEVCVTWSDGRTTVSRSVSGKLFEPQYP